MTVLKFELELVCAVPHKETRWNLWQETRKRCLFSCIFLDLFLQEQKGRGGGETMPPLAPGIFYCLLTCEYLPVSQYRFPAVHHVVVDQVAGTQDSSDRSVKRNVLHVFKRYRSDAALPVVFGEGEICASGANLKVSIVTVKFHFA